MTQRDSLGQTIAGRNTPGQPYQVGTRYQTILIPSDPVHISHNVLSVSRGHGAEIGKLFKSQTFEQRVQVRGKFLSSGQIACILLLVGSTKGVPCSLQ